MSKTSKRPAPLFRKPRMVPATAESMREVTIALGEQPADRLSRLLDEEGAALRMYVEAQGVPVRKRLPKDRPQPGTTYASVDGGFACYRKADVHPAVIEAVEALAAIEVVRRRRGELKVIAAIELGAAIERLRATAAFAKAVDGYRRSRAKPTVPDSQIHAALAKYPKLADAAAAVRLSERQLRDRRKRLKPEV